MAPRFLTSALDGVVIFTPLPLHSRERALDTYWIGGWVGPRFCLGSVEGEKPRIAGIEPGSANP
jgi:hypothetical protein